MAGMMGGAGNQLAGPLAAGNPAASAASTGPIGAVGAQGNQVTGLLTGPNFGVTPGNALIKNAAALQRVTAQANIGLGARPGVPGVGSPNATGGPLGASNPVALPAAGPFGMTVADGATAGAAAQPALTQALGAPVDGGASALLSGAAGIPAGMLGGAAGGFGGAAGMLGGAAGGGFAGGAQAGMAGGALGGAQAGMAGGALGGAQAGMLGGAAGGGFAGGGAAGGVAGQLQQATATGVNPITRTNSN